jgi:CRP-like cAMP-binding protein
MVATCSTGVFVLDYISNYLLASLPSEALNLLELEPVALPQGAPIFEPNESIDRIYFPETGMISLLVVTSEGDMVETAIVGREGALGIQRGLGRRQSLTRATVQIGGRFLTMAAPKFELAAAVSAPIREMIVWYTEVLWGQAQQTAACNAVHDASSRLCRWLLQSAKAVGSDQLALTQEFIGQMLGVRRTTVTLLAQHLQRSGAIRYRRGKISILDRATLEACACECHTVMQNLQNQKLAS